MTAMIVCFDRDPESQIIDYQTQQYKLFPMLASAYAIWFAGQKLQKEYSDFRDELDKGVTTSLPEVCLLDLLNCGNIFCIIC